ncbi:hypothetical protein [uncultured Metabacillus sp.]|uniref:hypothetical protein n=1 Tax=uncultured Metabacillus sp. TaxID=2860135 RepID=UPI00260D6EC1|nr:hypothetical protein [uncultured Metabacillus sp.]
MKELTPMQKAFFELWFSGHRFLTDEEIKSKGNGMYRESEGYVEGYTIEGLKNLARNKKMNFEGMKLTEEEVEIMFSFIKFMRQFK